MKLKCDIIVQNLNKNTNVNQEKPYKGATLGLYRPSMDELDQDTSSKTSIILTVEAKNLSLKYKLKRFETYTKFISEGKATLKLHDDNVYLLISNTPSQTLINFISFLNVKMAKTTINRPSNTINKENQPNNFVNKLLNNVQCTMGKSSLSTISPLTEKDLSDVMKAKAVKQGYTESPVRAGNRTALSVRNINAQAMKPTQTNQPTKQLLRHSSSTNDLMIQLTEEQKTVIKHIKEKKSVFFTGSGGTGKTFLISVIKKILPNDSCFLTASTGSAASLIGGMTIHTFAGVGTLGADSFDSENQNNSFESVAHAKIQKILNSKDKLNNWKKCQYLIIDEVSMIDAEFFDTLELIARSIKNNDLPFGGIQLIISGDFLQLPPVSKAKEDKKKFCFQARTWNDCIQRTVILTKIKRQTDNTFIDMLEEIRFGKCSAKTIELLEKTKKKSFDDKKILPTKLCTHKDDVDFINKKELSTIEKDKFTFNAVDTGDVTNSRQLLNNLCLAPELLILKLNAQVILVKNLDVSQGLVNGARGYVIGFNENKLPIVKFLKGTEMVMKYETWNFRVNSSGNTVTRKQLPLQLAWAISIHKSQGMTLDCVDISLSRVFECGQAYVALSRAKSLEGLRIVDFDIKSIRANEVVVKYYEKLKNNSNRFNFD